jgi:hypothetical protein
MITGFEQYAKKTRRAIFLEEMEQVVPWRKLCASGGSGAHVAYLFFAAVVQPV